MNLKYLERFQKIILIVLLPVISYGVLGPLETFFGNEKDFNFHYTDFVWCFLGISIAILLLVSAVLAVFPERVGRVAGAVVLGIGVSSYIQNMFMNVRLSEADGSPMRWEELGNYPVINAIIWVLIILVILAAYYFLKQKWYIFAIAVSVFLSAIQIIAVISLLLTASPAGDVTELQMSGEKQLAVAPKENIIVFVLDTVGNTNLDRTLELYPDALDGFKDFTYYSNADCHYYCTFPSLTHFLTGKEFDFESNSQDWMREAWESEKAVDFWNELDRAGYSCNLFSPDIGYVYGDIENLEGKFDNIKPVETVVNRSQLVKLLGKISIYRYVPYILKPKFEVLTNEFNNVVEYKDDISVVDDNGTFYNILVNNGLSIDPEMKNAFVIEHLFGVHQPYTIDENAIIVEESTIEEVIKGLIVIIEEYLQQLRDLKLYDNATIIITADHGAWYGGDSQPIFFIKRSKETHEKVQVNTAPISLDDFQATILSLLGKNYMEYGTAIYDWNEGDTRERAVYMRIVDDAYPAVEGSSFNVYYKYTYFTDKGELNNKIDVGPDEILPATSW